MNNTVKRGQRTYQFAETMPNNERVAKMKADQKSIDEAIELEKRQQKLKEAQKDLQEEELLKQMELAQMKKNDDDEEISEDQLRLKIDYVNKIENNLNLIIRTLMDNVSPYEINFSGIDLDLIYYTTIMNTLKDRGRSLHTLNLCRKGLNDKQHSKIISNILKENKP